MGTILCSAIVNKAEIILLDAANGRWVADDLFGWLKTGQRAAVILKPDISVTNSTLVMVEGTKQSLPAGGTQLIDIVRNMGTAGSTEGATIPHTTLNIINAINPDWHSETGASVVKAWMFDDRDPTKFWVYPPQPAASQGYVTIVYSKTPADPALISNVITIDDIYEPVLLDYVLYRAYQMDSAQARYASERSLFHYNQFVTALGRKDLTEKLAAPKPA